MGNGRVNIGRRAEQHPGLGLEVEQLSGIHNGRPGADIHPLRWGKDERAAPLGHQADRRHPGQLGNLVAPRSGGVDHVLGLKLAGRCLKPPARGLTVQAGHFGRGEHPSAVVADATQKPLVQTVHINICRVGLVDGAGYVFGLEYGQASVSLGRRQTDDLGAALARDRIRLVEQVELGLGPDHQHAARTQNGRFGKACGRRFIECPADPCKRSDQRWPIGLDEHRRRAAGGVVARLLFAFEHEDRFVLREPVANRRAGNPRPNNDKTSVHHNPSSRPSVEYPPPFVNNTTQRQRMTP